MRAGSGGMGVSIGTSGAIMMTEGYPPVAGGAFPTSPVVVLAGGVASSGGLAQPASASRVANAADRWCRSRTRCFVMIMRSYRRRWGPAALIEERGGGAEAGE